MRSHAERVLFDEAHLAALREATRLVALVDAGWADELRCHELARAVCHHLHLLGTRCAVRDGSLFAIEHSWIELLRAPSRTLCSPVLLDVYAPGRLPQVQLVFGSFVVSRGYTPRKRRDDVDLAVVRRLVDEMSGESLAPRTAEGASP